jgi:alpha-D-ribose 1-methylphosphonate 5-triphosphate synthase subunit PhnH
MSDALADVTPGFRDAVHGAQQAFRSLLDATARPGRIFELPPMATGGIEPPQGMSVGMAALLLALLDAETTLRLGGALAGDAPLTYLRFHTGVREALPGEPAAFHVLGAADAPASVWATLEAGSDEVPQRGATLIVEAPALHEGNGLQLRGPGIESMHRLAVAGLTRDFWRERIAMQPLFPRGVDLVLVCGTQLAVVPRSTHLRFEG